MNHEHKDTELMFNNNWEINNDHIAVMALTCGYAPTQFEGKLKNGKYFYFRERHGEATFSIADTLEMAIGAEENKMSFYKEKLIHTSPKIAAELIHEWVNEYFKST